MHWSYQTPSFNNTKDSSTYGYHQMVNTKIRLIYIFCSRSWKSSTQWAKTRPGADSGSDHELFIAKFRPKLKKVGKTTTPFRYDLKQIPYTYTVEVTNRFKGLDLIDRVPEELWMEVHNTVQEVVIKPSPRKRNAKRQNGCLRRPYKQLRKKISQSPRRKGKINPSECRVPKNSKER